MFQPSVQIQAACLLGALVLVAAPPVAAQDLDALKARVLEACGGEKPLPSRGRILSGDVARGDLVVIPAPLVPLPVHACPLCKQPMVNVPLWKERPGVDSSAEWTAHVCERDELFFATQHGFRCHAECGPFVLPRPGEKAARIALPWGALPETPVAPRPKSTWPVPDGSMWTEDAPDGRLVVRNAQRTLFHEPADAGNVEMGMFGDACKVSPSARLVAFARSQSPLIVGDLGTGAVRARLPMRGSNVVVVAIAPDGDEVVFLVAEAGQQTPSLRRLDVASGKVIEVARGMEHGPSDILFADRAELLITAAHSHHGVITAYAMGGTARRWQVTVDGTWTGWRSHTLSPDHKRLLVITRGGRRAARRRTRRGERRRGTNHRPEVDRGPQRWCGRRLHRRQPPICVDHERWSDRAQQHRHAPRHARALRLRRPVRIAALGRRGPRSADDGRGGRPVVLAGRSLPGAAVTTWTCGRARAVAGG